MCTHATRHHPHACMIDVESPGIIDKVIDKV